MKNESVYSTGVPYRIGCLYRTGIARQPPNREIPVRTGTATVGNITLVIALN